MLSRLLLSPLGAFCVLSTSRVDNVLWRRHEGPYIAAAVGQPAGAQMRAPLRRDRLADVVDQIAVDVKVVVPAALHIRVHP